MDNEMRYLFYCSGSVVTETLFIVVLIVCARVGSGPYFVAQYKDNHLMWKRGS